MQIAAQQQTQGYIEILFLGRIVRLPTVRIKEIASERHGMLFSVR